MNALYLPSKYTENVKIKDNPLFVPYDLLYNKKEQGEGWLVNSSSIDISQQSDEAIAIVHPGDNQKWVDKNIQAESKKHGSSDSRDKERGTVKEEDPWVIPSYFNPYNPSVLADHVDTQENMNKGTLESFISPCFLLAGIRSCTWRSRGFGADASRRRPIRCTSRRIINHAVYF